MLIEANGNGGVGREVNQGGLGLSLMSYLNGVGGYGVSKKILDKRINILYI